MYLIPVYDVVASKGANLINIYTAGETEQKAEYLFRMGDAWGPVLFIAYSGYGDFTVTFKKGEGPSASGEYSFVVPSGRGMCVPISTGEYVYKDGAVHFLLEGSRPINEMHPMFAVLRLSNTITH